MSDVVVLRWPAESARAEELARAGALRLLLIEPEADAPILEDDRADWLRLPADERDVAARVLALARRHPGDRPSSDDGLHVDRADRLFYGGRWVALSPIEARLATVLGRRLGSLVSTGELIDEAWPGGGELPRRELSNALRVHLTRLRKRVQPLGLEVRSVRSKGLVMQPR